MLSSSLTRRYRNNFQATVAYTHTFFAHDNATGFGVIANNQFNLDDEWSTAADFQRHTLRANGIVNLRWDVSLAASYLYGSGARFATTISGRPFNKPGTNRLKPGRRSRSRRRFGTGSTART